MSSCSSQYFQVRLVLAFNSAVLDPILDSACQNLLQELDSVELKTRTVHRSPVVLFSKKSGPTKVAQRGSTAARKSCLQNREGSPETWHCSARLQCTKLSWNHPVTLPSSLAFSSRHCGPSVPLCNGRLVKPSALKVSMRLISQRQAQGSARKGVGACPAFPELKHQHIPIHWRDLSDTSLPWRHGAV